MVERSLIVRYVVRSIPHDGPFELFLVPSNVPPLLCCLKSRDVVCCYCHACMHLKVQRCCAGHRHRLSMLSLQDSE